MNDAPKVDFPMEFPLKVMGRDSPEFQGIVTEIVARHVGVPAEALRVSSRPSAGGNFVAVTVTFTAQSREQLDAIYRELTGHELVLMAL